MARSAARLPRPGCRTVSSATAGRIGDNSGRLECRSWHSGNAGLLLALYDCQATIILPTQRQLKILITAWSAPTSTTITFPDHLSNRSCPSEPLRGTVRSPGETEAGSAGTQPDQGITRPTVCRWHSPDPGQHPGRGLSPPSDTGVHASENPTLAPAAAGVLIPAACWTLKHLVVRSARHAPAWLFGPLPLGSWGCSTPRSHCGGPVGQSPPLSSSDP